MRATLLRIVTVVVVTVAAIACQRSSRVSDLSSTDLAAIRATTDRWVAAVRAGRWDDAAATYTEDTIVWFPNAVHEGRAAVRKLLAGMPPLDPTRQWHIDEIQGRGDMAFVSGHSTVIPAGGAPIVVARYLDVRLRQADGTWLFYRDMVTPQPPPVESRTSR